MSYFISTVSIAMVLFLLGSVSYLILSVMNATDRMKSNVVVYVMLKDTGEAEREALLTKLTDMEEVKGAVYVPKDKAAKEFIEAMDEDFTEFLDFNPLPDSYEVRINADGKGNVRKFEKTVVAWPEVEEVVYQRGVVDQIGININKINIVLMIFGLLLLTISVILLNNTIRVTIYSKRYIISTMKLVGATPGFVMRPFLRSAVLQGIYAALIAAVFFGVLVAGLNEGLPELSFVAEKIYLVWVVAGMFLVGILISLIFTMLAVNKFIRMRTNAIHLY